MIPAVMKSGKSSVVKEAMWLTSNIAAGNKTQIQSIFDANLIPLIVEVLKKVSTNKYNNTAVALDFISIDVFHAFTFRVISKLSKKPVGLLATLRPVEVLSKYSNFVDVARLLLYATR